MPRPIPTTLAVLVAALCALSAGCVGNDAPQRIHVRRTPEEVARWHAGPGTYAELKEKLKRQDEARELDGELSRSEAWLKVSKLHIAAAAKPTANDPWESYEDERRRVLYKHWTDRFGPPPVIEGEPLPGEAPPPSEEEEEPAEEEKTDDSDDYGY